MRNERSVDAKHSSCMWETQFKANTLFRCAWVLSMSMSGSITAFLSVCLLALADPLK